MKDIDFLHKIAADPEPDLPRLIYADWLEERGDPRAEFIRLQCERALLHPSDPRHQELLQQEEQLLRKSGKRWLRQLAGNWKGVELIFHRGVIEEAILSGDTLLQQGRKLLAAIPTLRRLDLSNLTEDHLRVCQQLPCLAQIRGLKPGAISWECRTTFLERLLDCPWSPRLKSLELHRVSFREGWCGLLADANRLPELEHLRISNNWHNDDDFRSFTSGSLAAQLKTLRLGWTWHDLTWWEPLLNRPARLEQIANAWIPDELEGLLASPHLERLRTLEVPADRLDPAAEIDDLLRITPDLQARLQARFGADCLREVHVPWV